MKKYKKPSKLSVNSLQNKIVLVSGASGSIGSALCYRIAQQKPKNLVILDQDETGIFNLYEDLKGMCKVSFVIASVRDEERIEQVFKAYRPEIVYHGAAYKHVAMMEASPEEAYKTNVIGTYNMILSAIDSGVQKFVFISTDKVIRPLCVMGKTKQAAERACLSANKNGKTKFIVVRFGNVMASRGSVIPIWQKQLSENKALTVTHKGMRRYFMGIYEAVDLVIQATRLGKGGEVMVLDMGKQIKVAKLAELMIKISGKPLDIIFTEKKKGEKISEQLMTAKERRRAVKKGKIFIIHGN